MHTFSKNLLLLVALGLLLAYLNWNFSTIGKGTDFFSHYAAARMVRDGLGHSLYQPGMQPRYQAKYLGQVGPYHAHPSFEMVMFLPLTWLPVQQAYVLWCVAGLAFLIAAVRLLASHIFALAGWRVLLFLLLLFVPVLLNFLQGQDAVLLLLVLAGVLVALRQRRDFSAGCFLACGLFRFHLILPLILMLGLKKPRSLAGFVLVASGLVLVSMAFSGSTFLIDYPRFLLHLSDLSPSTNRPQGMPTVRGLIEVLVPSMTLRWPLIATFSLLIVGVAAWGWIRAGKASQPPTELSELALANAITAGILVGYSVNPHDLTILLIPMLCLLRHLRATNAGPQWWRIGSLAMLAILFLPALHLWLLEERMYVFVAVPVLLLFLLTHLQTRPSLPQLSRNR